ncbi:hypothetical protein [Halalkalibaculum sp. DA384]|uniref:hypothetical protein n=1 Tax=Halalkalibaculum sp. DA384 TaxID=3373606 RepID=UPI003754171C
MYFRLKKTLPCVIAALCLIILGCNPEREADSESHNHVQESDGTYTVTGKLSGFDCAVVGSLCPTTHRGADYTTGVYTEDGSFYFVVNIPQSFLRQHFLETVEVEGTVYDPYKRAVEPEAIRLVEDEGRRLVYEAGYFIDENNGRATFQEGVYRNGRWIAD